LIDFVGLRHKLSEFLEIISLLRRGNLSNPTPLTTFNPTPLTTFKFVPINIPHYNFFKIQTKQSSSNIKAMKITS
jgi:hypothetical protein